MLEPRRLAARAAAHRMATTLGEPVGGPGTVRGAGPGTHFHLHQPFGGKAV